MRFASIDMGSNTILLLIADVDSDNKIIPIHHEYLSPRLGNGLKSGGEIKEESIEKLFDAMELYNSLINKYKCEKVFINATMAMRLASNSSYIVNEIKKRYGYETEIIPGEREAMLSFIGASSVIGNDENRVVIDIGGGSTEVIIGNKTEIFFRKSFKIGTVSFTEKYISKYPIIDKEYDNLSKGIFDTFSELKELNIVCNQAIAVAGTPTTLACINKNQNDYIEEEVENSILTISDLERISAMLKHKTPEQVLLDHGSIVEGRSDVIFTGSMILLNLLKTLKIEKAVVSAKGLRYGIIVEYIEQNLKN